MSKSFYFRQTVSKRPKGDPDLRKKLKINNFGIPQQNTKEASSHSCIVTIHMLLILTVPSDCVPDLDLRNEKIIFQSFLITFEEIVIF